MDNNPLNLKVKDGKLYQKGKRTSIGEVLLKFFAGMALMGLLFVYVIYLSLNTIIIMIVEPWENWASERGEGHYGMTYDMKEVSDFDWGQGDWFFLYTLLVGLIVLVLFSFFWFLKSKYILIRLVGKLLAYIIVGWAMFGVMIWEQTEFYPFVIWLNS